MKETVEYNIGQKCYKTSSGKCVIKCIKYFSKKDYSEDFKDFIRNEK